MTPKKALIVDDSRLAQFVLKKMLVAQDMEVDTSESAEEALGYLRQHKPDMIFLDHSMPGMNGLEALKVIKDNPSTSTIPVMMYTSQEDSSYMSQAQELGAVDVLPKQMTAGDLEQLLVRLGKEPPASANESATQTDTPTAVSNTDIIDEAVDEEELRQLVEDAEAALEKETNQQTLRLKIDKVHQDAQQAIMALNEKLDRTLPTIEGNNNKQLFWNNLLWGAVYTVTVIFFGIAYFQQQNAIQQLSLPVAAKAPEPKTPPSAAITPDPTPVQPAPPPATAPPTTATTAALPTNNRINEAPLTLSSLENLFNENNQIPYGELLLGETVQASLADLIPALQTIDFTGEVVLLAHDGTFCVNTGNSGQFELANDNNPVSQCELAEPSARLADIASIDLLQLITASNQSPDNDFVITINPMGTSRPVSPYPDVSNNTTAGTWNGIALRNRRVEIELIEEE